MFVWYQISISRVNCSPISRKNESRAPFRNSNPPSTSPENVPHRILIFGKPKENAQFSQTKAIISGRIAGCRCQVSDFRYRKPVSLTSRTHEFFAGTCLRTLRFSLALVISSLVTCHAAFRHSTEDSCFLYSILPFRHALDTDAVEFDSTRRSPVETEMVRIGIEFFRFHQFEHPTLVARIARGSSLPLGDSLSDGGVRTQSFCHRKCAVRRPFVHRGLAFFIYG